MANITASNFTREGERRDLSRPVQVNIIIAIIVNSIACPFTVLLNVMVIRAVKKTGSLQTNANILLACLAATDVFTGLVSQPLYILSSTFRVLGLDGFSDTLRDIQGPCLRVMTICSLLHIMLVTFERLIAIRFTEHYPYIFKERNIKVAVIALWIFTMSVATLIPFKNKSKLVFIILDLLSMLTVISCVLFIASSYVILYRETLRHRKKIKTQQLPQEEVQRFAKESKVLKTTVLVVGAVVLYFLCMAFVALFFLFETANLKENKHMFVKSCLPCPWLDTFVMLNSLFNPLIYCYRQKEMRQFVFRLSSFRVAPVQN